MYAVLANQTEVLVISLGAVGLLLGANRLIRIPGNLVAGALNDRMGRRRLFLVGLLLGVLSTLSYGLARGFWPLLAGRLLWGCAWSLINVTGYTMVLDWSTPADRGRMTGFYQMAFLLGLTLSPLLGGMLTDALGFRQAVRICAAVSAVGLGVALVALPETRSPNDAPAQGFRDSVRRWRLAALAGVWRRLDRRILRAAYIYLVAFFVNGGVLMSTVGLYLNRRWGDSIALGGVVLGVASLTGLMLALRSALGIVAGPLAGAVSDRTYVRGDHRLRNRWPVVRGGILLGVAGFVVLAPPLDSLGVWTVVLGVALVALSAGAMIATLAALVGDLAPRDRPGTTMGALATAGDIGSATGPLVAYALAVSLDLRWVYLMCAVALGTALLATVGQGKEK
jgi:MFS family permease